MSENKEDLIRKLKKRQQDTALACIKSFYVFFINFWEVNNSDPLVDNWHIRYLCDEMQRIGLQIACRKKFEQDEIFNVPPGTSKSSIVSQAFVPWLWLHAPWAVIYNSSYSSELANDHSFKARNILKSAKYQELFQPFFALMYGFQLRLIKDQDKEVINNFGGVRMAISTLGSVTGRHAHGILRDDPMSAEQAESENWRRRVHRYNDKTLGNRKKDAEKTPTVTIAQRLNEDDSTGHDLAIMKDKVRLHCLPAELSSEVKPAHLKKYYVDGLLDPVRLNRKVLEYYKQKLGSAGYAGQYKQRPFDEESAKVKRAWFKMMKETDIPSNIRWEMWIDGAYTESTKNDPSGILIVGHDKFRRRLIVRKFINKFMELPDLIKECINLDELYNIYFTYIEPKASGYSLIQMLRNDSNMNVREITGKLVSQGKTARLNAASPRVESGRVYVVEDHWNEEFFTQITGFPLAAHDEAVDLLGYSCDKHLTVNKRGAATVEIGQ